MEKATARTEVALRNIVVATDFSSTSERALQFAATIARRYQSTIHMVHVSDPTAMGFLTPEAITGAYSEAYDGLRQAAHERLKEQAGHLTEVRYQLHVLEGATSEAVETVVRDNQIDLVVVGTAASAGLKKLVFGSTAEEIFRRATCPVLTVGPHAPVRDDVAGVNCILFPTDLASDESAALAHAISLAQRYGARLLLLYVMAGVQPPSPKEKEWFEKPDLNRLHRLIPAGTELPHPAECRIEYHDPAPDVILRVAGEIAADLIVLSVRPAEAWATRIPDKAYRIVAGSPCPVLTVREKESA